MCRLVLIILLVFNLLLSFVPPPVWGQGSPEPGANPEKKENGAALAEKINNPLSDLWLLSIQSDFQWWNGAITDKTRLVNITLLQPVMPFALSENWRMIVRPVFPFASFPFSGFDYETGPKGPIPVPNFTRQNGLGDIVLWTAFTNRYTPPTFLGLDPP